MGVEKLSLLLFEKQTDKVTPSDSLGQNDFCDCLEAPRIQITPDVEQDNRGSSGYDNYPPTVGRTQVELSVAFPIKSMGSGVSDPDMVRVMECAGWERRLDGGYIKMHPVNEIVNAGTAWCYYGGPGAQKALLDKAGNLMFDGSITLEAGKRVVVRLMGKGKYLAKPVRATMPNVGAMRERFVAAPLMAAGITVNGKAYGFQKGEITLNQSSENNVDASDQFGGGDTEITDRKIEWSATVYQKVDSSFIPHDNLFAGVTGSLDFMWGSAYHYPDCRIVSAYATITDVKHSNINNVLAWDLKGVIERNDLEIWMWNGNASSYSSVSNSLSSDSNSSTSDSSASDSSSSGSSSSVSV